MDRDELLRRFKPFQGRWDIRPSSYEIQNLEGQSAGWVAHVLVIENRGASEVWHKLTDQMAVPPNPRTFAAREVADAAAVMIAIGWLEENG